MKDANVVLEDSSLKLAVQLDDTRKQARDLETAFDMTTDSSLDVAKAEVGLIKSIDAKSKATERATDQIDTVAYAQRNSAHVESEYQKALERRTELENKISQQSPIIRYSEQATGGEKPKELPKPEEPVEKIPPVADKDKQLQDFLKSKGLSSRSEFEKQRTQEAKDRKIEREENRGMITKVMLYAGDKITKSMVSGFNNAISTMSSGLESVLGLNELPMYQMAKSITKSTIGGAVDVAKFTGGLAVDKFKESRFERTKEKATKEFYNQTTPMNGEEKSQAEGEKKDRDDQKRERVENKRERDNTDKRHKSIVQILKDLGKIMLFSGLVKMVGGLLGSIATLTGGLFSRFGGLLLKLGGLGASLAAAMTKSLGSLFSKTFPSFGKKTPSIDPKTGKKVDVDVDKNKKVDVDGKKKAPNVEIDADGKPKVKPAIEPGKTPDLDVNAGKKAGGEVAEGVGKKAAAKAETGLFQKVFSKVGMKTAGKVIGRVATKFIPFVGTALLLKDLYDVADYASDGKISEMVGEATNGIKQKLSAVGDIQAGLPPASEQLESSEEMVKRAESEKKIRDQQREDSKVKAMQAMYTNQQVNNNTTVMSSPFSFQPDHHFANNKPYGVQSR